MFCSQEIVVFFSSAPEKQQNLGQVPGFFASYMVPCSKLTTLNLYDAIML